MMADRRRYTGTKTLQTAWTVVVAVAVAGWTVALPTVGSPVLRLGGGGVAWVAGLLVLGVSERRHWRRMVERSTFEPDVGPHTADLQKILQGQSVTVSTDVPGLFSQTHTTITAPVEGVDASFTIRISDSGSADDHQGVQTGNETLDEQFVIRGSEQNLQVLLSADVQAALMDVTTPGTFTVTDERVAYEIPFARLRGSELDAAGEAVATIASRLEDVG
jgi:hypothetical protein